MSVKDMWKANAITRLLLVVINLMIFSLGNTPWMVLGLLLLAGACYLSFRQGMGLGHEGCAILATVHSASDPASPAYGQLDEDVLKRTWSRERGLKGVLASALAPYAICGVYIICMLLDIQWEMPLFISRLLAWIITLPYWPIILPWQETFDVLNAPIVAVMLVSPFVLPLCMYAGYLQGPKLWAKSEQAMAQGRRRAKAKSRVAQKKVPRERKPEI